MGDFERQHARLAPSAGGRWTTCSAAPNREEGRPDNATPYAIQGLAAHDLLESCLKKESNIDGLETFTTAETTLDEEEVEAVRTAVKYVHDASIKRHTGFPIESERIVYPGLFFNREDCWGTLDVSIDFRYHDGSVEIIDYKHGSGYAVEVEANAQLLLYAIGVYAEYHKKGLLPPKFFKLTIIQPRISHPDGFIRSWNVTIDDLVKWVEYFRLAAFLTDDPEAQASPSEEACFFCKAKGDCPEYAEHALAAARAIFQPIPLNEIRQEDLEKDMIRQPDRLTPEQISFIVDNANMIRGFLKAVEDYARIKLLNGEEIPRLKLVAGRASKRTWKGEEDAVMSALKRLSKMDGRRISTKDIFTTKLNTPAQIETKLKPVVGKQTWKSIENLIQKTQGKPTIAPLSDSRPALPVSAKQVFKPINPLSFMD